MSAALIQMKFMEYFISRTGVKENANALNESSFTTLDVLKNCMRDLKGMEVQEILLEACVPRAKNPKTLQPSITEKPTTQTRNKVRQFLSKVWTMYIWLEKACGNLLIMAVILATITYQVGINPPRGVWQDDNDRHEAGTAILATIDPDAHAKFLTYNTIAFIISLSIILLTMSGFPLKNSMWVLKLAICVTGSSWALIYFVSIGMISSADDKKWESVTRAADTFIWAPVFVFLLYTTHLLAWPVDKLRKFVLKR